MNQIISLRILSLVASGMDLKDAFNTVFGVGAFEKMVSDLYEQMSK